MSEPDQSPPAETPPPAPEADPRVTIRTGTFLHPCCPDCGCDLVEEDRVHLAIIGPKGEPGELRLSPRFNVFRKESTIALEKGAQIQDLLCPGCQGSMVEPDRPCERCGSSAARLRVSVVHLDLDLYICTRIGCHWHGLAEEDGQRVVLDDAPDEEGVGPER